MTGSSSTSTTSSFWLFISCLPQIVNARHPELKWLVQETPDLSSLLDRGRKTHPFSTVSMTMASTSGFADVFRMRRFVISPLPPRRKAGTGATHCVRKWRDAIGAGRDRARLGACPLALLVDMLEVEAGSRPRFEFSVEPPDLDDGGRGQLNRRSELVEIGRTDGDLHRAVGRRQIEAAHGRDVGCRRGLGCVICGGGGG